MQAEDLARWRLHSVGLTGARFGIPEATVEWLLGVQSQDYGPAVWSVGQRTVGATADVVEQAFAHGRILRTHVLRPTWHFVLPGEIRWLLALTGPRVQAGNAGMYRQEELDVETLARAESILGRALEGGGQLTRPEMAERLAAGGIEAAGPRLGYVLMHAELEGLICSGGMYGKQHTYALLDERAPGGRTLSREDALTQLVRRYFMSHGPATVKDCASWASLTLTDVRAGLEEAAPYLVSVESDGTEYWGAAETLSRAPRVEPVPVRLVQGYDEYIVGYTDSKGLLDLGDRAGAMRSRPIWNGVLLAGTQVVGHWKRTITKTMVTFEVAVYRPLDADEFEALRGEVERHGRFLERQADLSTRVL